MNNVTLTSRIVSLLSKTSKDKFGFVKTSVRIQESKAGGVDFKLPETCAKSFIQSERRNLLLAGSSVSFLSMSATFAECENVDSVLQFVYNGKKELVDFRPVKTDSAETIERKKKTRQQRLTALGVRIKKAYGDLFGLTETQVKAVNFSADQILQILNASGSYFTRNTQKYVVKIVVAKTVKATTKTKSEKAKIANKIRKPQTQASV